MIGISSRGSIYDTSISERGQTYVGEGGVRGIVNEIRGLYQLNKSDLMEFRAGNVLCRWLRRSRFIKSVVRV
jgi:hypothetical protein